MIAVLDYGIGNLRSAQKALEHLGAEAELVRDPDVALRADGVVLPGVGAFGACAKALRASGLDLVAKEVISENRPFLAVCVGFQLLFEGSEEDSGVSGLGVFDGVVRRLTGPVKLPQIQWNELERCGDRDAPMLRGLGERPWFYFVHSYAPVPGESSAEYVVAHCDYGSQVVAAMQRDHLWATQFHPEKSATSGLSLLANFVAQCSEEVRDETGGETRQLNGR